MEQEIMQNANFEWLATLFVGIFSAFAGTFLGAVLLNHLQKSNMRKNRGTAVKALKILKKYDTKKYGEAKSQFNIELSISEKRAVLVLLHKMGIPIQIPASNKFDIKDIEFADITIDGKEINGIIDQVKGGYCDMLIFNDVEAYFTSNIRVSAVRNTGEKYVKEVIPSLMEKYNYKTVMLVPKIEKIVVNIGVGDAISNSKLLEAAMHELEQITGQKAVATKAKKSIASFKLREGNKIGCKVTLRGEKMYNFLDKLISIGLPRVRDFRGLSPKSFDGRGNYTIGIKEQLIFSEVDFDSVIKVRGMDIVIVTSAKTNEESYDLLNELGIPFRK